MVLSGVDERSRELLRITSLDMVWPIYQSKREAIEAPATGLSRPAGHPGGPALRPAPGPVGSR